MSGRLILASSVRHFAKSSKSWRLKSHLVLSCLMYCQGPHCHFVVSSKYRFILRILFLLFPLGNHSGKTSSSLCGGILNWQTVLHDTFARSTKWVLFGSYSARCESVLTALSRITGITSWSCYFLICAFSFCDKGKYALQNKVYSYGFEIS